MLAKWIFFFVSTKNGNATFRSVGNVKMTLLNEVLFCKYKKWQCKISFCTKWNKMTLSNILVKISWLVVLNDKNGLFIDFKRKIFRFKLNYTELAKKVIGVIKQIFFLISKKPKTMASPLPSNSLNISIPLSANR